MNMMSIPQPQGPQREWIEAPTEKDGERVSDTAAAEPLADICAAGMGAAMEEATLQFGDAVEALESALEQRMGALYGGTDERSVSIEDVRKVMRLMEGREGFDALRGQARAFAKACREGREDALEALSHDALEPHERYAVLRLAAHALERAGEFAGAGRVAAHAQALAGRHGGQIHGLYGASPAREPARAAAGSEDVLRLYFELLAVKPSARSVLDAAAEIGGADRGAQALLRMQKSWGGQTAQLERIGMFMAVSRLVSSVQSMVANGRALIAYSGRAPDAALAFKHARALIDIAATSAPGGLLDKLATVVVGPATREARHGFFSFMHRQVRQWPEAVWASAEGKGAVLQQLLRRQVN